MASPQTENGYTMLANELLEKIYQSDFTLRELKIILTVLRYSYGFSRKEAKLSLTFLSQATKIPLRHVQTTIKNLISKNVLVVISDFTGIHPRKIKLNKDYDSWQLVLTKPVNSKSDLVLTNPVNSSIDQKSNSSIDQSGQPRKKTLKKNIKKRSSYSIDNIPVNLNGQLFYKNDYFYITTDLKNELIQNIKGLTEDRLGIEFYKMKVWLEKNGKKTDYKRFIVTWLSKNDYSLKSKTDHLIEEDF